jgi:hypothetical protein
MQLSSLYMDVVQYAHIAASNVAPLDDSDFEVLKEIRQVLKETGNEDRFGVSLLARNFNIKSNEAIMEFSDDDARTSTWNVVSADDPVLNGNDVLKTNWEFDRNGLEMSGRCKVVHCHYDHGHRRIHIWV